MAQKKKQPFTIVKAQSTLKRFFTGENQLETLSYFTEGTDLITIEEAELINSSIPIKKLKSVELYSTRKPFLTPISRACFEKCLEEKLVQYARTKLISKCLKLNKGTKMISTKLAKYLRLVNLLESGWDNYKELGDKFDIDRREVRNIAMRLQKNMKGLPTKFKRPKKLSQEHLNFIDEYIQAPINLGCTLHQIKEALIQYFNLKPDFISITTIYKALWHLKITYKKVYPISQEKNSPRVKTLRYFAASYILKAMENNYDIIYIDEVGFNQNIAKNYAFSKTKKQAKIVLPHKSENYSVIAALNSEGFLGFQIFKGGVKSEDFCCFILALVKKLSLLESDKPICFVMDNAQIHKSIIFKEKILPRFAVIYNSPYSPELNAIEESFSKWKHLVRQKKNVNEKTLLMNIVKAAPKISNFDAMAYIRHSLSFFEICYKKEDL